jgi:hypothetical protein
MIWIAFIVVGIFVGLLNALYWKKQGYPFWSTFYFGSIVGFGGCMAIYKVLK